MDSLITQNEKKPILNKGLIIGALVGVAAIGIVVVLLMQTPSMEDQKAAVLADALHVGDPLFEQLTNDIVLETDFSKTVESPNAFGSISMYIAGNVKNKGSRTFNGLSVNSAVVDIQNRVLKEKDVLVVPTQRGQISPGETIPITLEIAGFDRKADRANIRWKVTAIRLPAQ